MEEDWSGSRNKVKGNESERQQGQSSPTAGMFTYIVSFKLCDILFLLLFLFFRWGIQNI